MSQPGDSEMDESRTQYFRSRRTLATVDGTDSSASTPGKRSRRSRRGPQNHRDFVPMGGSFSNSGQTINAASPDAGNSSDSSAASVHDPESHRARSTDMKGSTSGPSATRPRLPGNPPILGQNRLITGFAKTHNQPSTALRGDTPEVSRNDCTSLNNIGESADDAIEISDDTDMEDQSEDGGMMINVDDESAGTNQESSRHESSLSDGEIKQVEERHAPIVREKRSKCRNCGEKGHKTGRCPLNRKHFQNAPASSTRIHGDHTHVQLQGDVERSLSNLATAPNTGLGPTPQRLGDLPTDELEKQVKYTLFHLKRDQIDLNRPTICTICLQQGHRESSCPESNCAHCGVQDEHPSRMCPTYRRCLKCRERGHDIDACVSKLKNTTVPCEQCGSEAHLEDSCPLRFFPIQSYASVIGLRWWISCCICAGKTHLVGDCPERRPSSQAIAWSLKSFDPMQINNLSLESGTLKVERDVDFRGTRQQGLIIKGRADTHDQVQGDALPSVRPPARRQDASPRGRGQRGFADRDFDRNRRVGVRRHDSRDDFYRPSTDSRPQDARHDRYESTYTDYRDQSNDRRDKFYATDSFGQRRRSRSPDFRNARATQRNDSFQPPLPREPLPSRPRPPARQGSLPSTSSNRTKDRGPPGLDSYRPMPSAAKQAWDKHRL